MYAFAQKGIYDVLIGINRRDSGNTKSSRGFRLSNNADGDYTSAIAKISASPSDDQVLSLAYNYDKAHDNWDDSQWGRQIYKNEQHRLTGKWEYSANDFVNLVSAVQYVHSEYFFDSGAKKAQNKFDSIGGNIQNTTEIFLLGNHSLTIGGDLYKKNQSGTTIDPFSGSWQDDTGRPDAEALDAGLFIQDAYAITPYLTISPIVRWNYYNRSSNQGFETVTDNTFTPGITLSIKPVQNAEFWLSVNTGYRPPVMDELYFTMSYPGVIDTAIVVANPDLKPEKSTNWETGTNLRLQRLLSDQDTLNIKAALFYDDVKDFIGTKSWMDTTNPTIWYFSTTNYGHVIRKGVEISAHYVIDNFGLDASYGLVHATNREDNKRVPGITPQSASIRLGYTIPKSDLDLWYRIRWCDGGKSNEETSWGSGQYREYAGYLTHALGLQWSPKVPGFENLTAGMAMTNLFDKKYRMLNGSYGYGRSAQVWLSAQF